mmetsp:Transcript_34819/g.137378  ORF Transcript_34819/g.137378 Transcript_34819/m.137378 type:complete len:291 (-) Transcript_34819:1738-2610(-)
MSPITPKPAAKHTINAKNPATFPIFLDGAGTFAALFFTTDAEMMAADADLADACEALSSCVSYSTTVRRFFPADSEPTAAPATAATGTAAKAPLAAILDSSCSMVPWPFVFMDSISSLDCLNFSASASKPASAAAVSAAGTTAFTASESVSTPSSSTVDSIWADAGESSMTAEVSSMTTDESCAEVSCFRRVSSAVSSLTAIPAPAPASTPATALVLPSSKMDFSASSPDTSLSVLSAWLSVPASASFSVSVPGAVSAAINEPPTTAPKPAAPAASTAPTADESRSAGGS